MSSPAKVLVEVPRSNDVEAPSVEYQLAKLRSDLDHLKRESRSWMKTWGVYLGLLGAFIALWKGALDLVAQLWQRPDTSVAIQEITIYHIPGLPLPESVKGPIVVTNMGNRDDVLLNNGAWLNVAGQSVELSEADFGLFENGKKVDTSLRVPKDESRAYDVMITFNPKTREMAATPGLHKLELHFLGVKQQSYLASFCFRLQVSDVKDLFESQEYQHQRFITQQCSDRS